MMRRLNGLTEWLKSSTKFTGRMPPVETIGRLRMVPPMRPILMTADPIGGVWQYALELCQELAKRDVNVVLATMGRQLERGERASVGGLPNVELCESAYKLEWMTDSWNDVTAAGQWLLD